MVSRHLQDRNNLSIIHDVIETQTKYNRHHETANNNELKGVMKEQVKEGEYTSSSYIMGKTSIKTTPVGNIRPIRAKRGGDIIKRINLCRFQEIEVNKVDNIVHRWARTRRTAMSFRLP